METIIVSKKALQNLAKRQEEVNEEVKALRSIVLELAKEEVRPAVAKQLAMISKGLDRGRGRRFRSFAAFKTHLRAL